VSEYRALRATVVRLWTRELSMVNGDALLELTRFSEGIDQALGESIAYYTAARERSHEIFLGVLSHDLRTPIGTVLMSAEYLRRAGNLNDLQEKPVSQIIRSATRIKQLVADLIGVAHIRLGGSLPIDKRPIALGDVCELVVDEVRAFHPRRTLKLITVGDLHATADPSRIAELLTNLLQNAVQHGRQDTPISLAARGEVDRVILIVHNEGAAISANARRRMFEPLVKGESQEGSGASDSLGLGLYIAREITTAHGGSIEIESSDSAGTSFTVSLPRC